MDRLRTAKKSHIALNFDAVNAFNCAKQGSIVSPTNSESDAILFDDRIGNCVTEYDAIDGRINFHHGEGVTQGSSLGTGLFEKACGSAIDDWREDTRDPRLQ
eukprot:5549405-Pyramimonas_sp.AAC.1